MNLDFDISYIVDNESLTERLLRDFKFPHKYINSPVDPSKKGFSELKKIIKQGLYSRLESLFYIFAGACGCGKSNLVMENVQEWKIDGFAGDASAIIVLATLKDIGRFIEGCGLDREDYACVTPDQEYCGLGLGKAKANEARIIFVKHAKAWRRLQETGSFAAIEEFHYQGKPRTFRLWDEAFSAAPAVSFKLDDLNMLAGAVRTSKPELANMIDALIPNNSDRIQGTKINFPREIAEPAAEFTMMNRHWLKTNKRLSSTLEGLAYLAGRHAVLRSDNLYKWMVVGTGHPVPDDLAPLIVLDASANISDTYRIWANRDSRVMILPPEWADYSKLTLHWWEEGAGKSTLSRREYRERIVGAVTDLLNSKSTAKSLVVLGLDVVANINGPGYSLKDEIEKLLSDSENVEFVHWGRHVGTNDYREIQNVVIVGGVHYGDAAYEAIAMAATGNMEGNDRQVVASIAHSEFAQNVYQGVGRCNVRNILSGTAGEATAYLIASGRKDRQPYLEKAFPGCAIVDWTPRPPKQKRKIDLIMEKMLELLAILPSSISTMELKFACGASDKKDYWKGVWANEKVTTFMRKRRIKKVGNTLKRI